jgi:hypothetical protein
LNTKIILVLIEALLQSCNLGLAFKVLNYANNAYMTIAIIRNQLNRFYKYWISLSPIKYVLFSTMLSLILAIPFGIIFSIVGITEYQIMGPEFEKYSILENFLSAVIIAPIIETFIGQVIPIKLIKKYVNWNTTMTAVIVSTLLFSILHITYSVWYFLMMVPLAFILAVTYISFQERKPSGFWMTAFVHAAKNLLAITILSIEKMN